MKITFEFQEGDEPVLLGAYTVGQKLVIEGKWSQFYVGEDYAQRIKRGFQGVLVGPHFPRIRMSGEMWDGILTVLEPEP